MRDLLSDFAPMGGAAGPELIVDCFAGGGGASTGIYLALGRHPDIAVNHDRAALAMHRANHPSTLHVSRNIYQVDPMDLVGRRRVGLLWASPDCKHFSKAKGGKPVKRNIRDLAWTVVTWAKRARPRVILLENVEEFRTWGPVVPDGAGGYRPCPDRQGQTFEAWVRELRRLGYRVEWRELRACDYGAPTIRKRLFVIARRDGQPIRWPEPTHGAPDSPEVLAGKRLPWRTAAEIIDWSLPCPSIFETSEAILERHGVRAKRPLADATLRRIARGVMRYVVDAARPFLVVCNHGGDGFRGQSLDEPMPTLTASRDAFGLVSPVVTYGQQGGGNRSAALPLHTVTASAKDQNAVIAAFLAQHNSDSRRADGVNPGRPADAPLATLTATGSQQGLIAAHVTIFNTGSVGSGCDAPLPTVTANSYVQRPGGAAPLGVVAAHLSRQFGASTGSALDAPVGTITAGGAGKAALVAASMMSLRGSDRRAYPVDAPVRTASAGGSHEALIAAFLDSYYGTSEAAAIDRPMGTDTTRDRRSLVTVEVDGATYALVDIGMRMLTPRERFAAQGFPVDYQIETGIDADGSALPLTQSDQGRMCGNSVCPPLAEALVRANCADMALCEVAA